MTRCKVTVNNYKFREPKMKRILITCLFIFAQAVMSQSAPTLRQRFDAEILTIADTVEAGKMGPTEGAREMLMAARAYFPNDTLTHAYYESTLSYAERFERKEITQAQALELLQIRTARYNEALTARTQEQMQRNRIAQEENARQREHQAQERARLEYLAGQEAEEARRRAMIGGMLQGIGGAFRNAYGHPGVNCSTTAMPGVLTTNCR